MAWSRLQSNGTFPGTPNIGDGSPSTIDVAYTTNLSSGSVLIALVVSDSDNATTGELSSLCSVKDTAGNAFTFLGGSGGNGDTYIGLFALATPSGDVGTKPTITATFIGSFDSFAIGIVIQEVSGIEITTDGSAVGDFGMGTGNGSSWSTGTYGDTAADEYLVVGYGDGFGVTTATASGYTADANNVENNEDINACLFYKNSSDGTETTSGTTGVDGLWCSVIVAFKLASTGVTVDQVGTVYTSQDSPATISFAFPGNPTAGSTVIVWIATYSALAGSITDNGATPSTFTLDIDDENQNAHIYMARANNITLPSSGGYEVSFSVGSGGSFCTGGAVSYLGVRTGTPTATNSDDAASGTALSTGAVSSIGSGALYVAAFASNIAGSATISAAGGGFTNEQTSPPQLPGGYANQITSGSQTCSWTLGTSAAWAAVVAVYEAASASGPTITTASLPNGIIGHSYSTTLEASGGTTPYTWSISSGSLPGWASLASSTGIISGTPTGSPTTTSFTVEVTDADSNTDTQPLSITTIAEQALQSAVPGIPTPGLFVPGELISSGVGPVQHNETITAIVVTSSNVTRKLSKTIKGTVVNSAHIIRAIKGIILIAAIAFPAKTLKQIQKIIIYFQTTANAPSGLPGWSAIPGIIDPGMDIPGSPAVPSGGGGSGGGLSMSGSLSTQNVISHLLTLAGSFVLKGATVRKIAKPFVSIVATVNSITRRLAHALSAVLTVTGAATRQVSRSFVAEVVVFATMIRTATRTLTAALAATAAAARFININLPYLVIQENPPGAIANDAEGGTSGVTVTTGNSGGISGNAWDSVSIGGTGDIIFDDTIAAHGVNSYNFTTTNSVNCYLTWTTTLGEHPQQWFRVYMYLTEELTGDTTYIKVSSGGTYAIGFQITATNGFLQLQNSSFSDFHTGSHAVPLNQWFRLEGFVLGDPAVGQVGYNLYDSMDSTTPTESYTSAATLDTIGNPDEFDFGSTFGDKTDFLCQMDDIAVSNTGFIGPVTSYASSLIGISTSVATTVIHGGIEYFLTVVSAIVAIPSTQRAAARILTGITIAAGTTKRVCNRIFASVLAVTAKTSRDTARTFTGTLTTASTVTRNISKSFNPIVTLTSSIIRNIRRTLNGVVVSAARATRDCGKTLTSNVSVTSGIIRRVFRPVTAITVVTVSLVRSIMRSITAVVAVTAAAVIQKFKLVTLNAVVVAASSAVRQVGRPLSAVIVTKSTVTRQVKRILNGSIGVTSAVTRGVTRTLTSPVPVSAVITSIKFKIVTLTVNIVVNSTITRSISRAFAGITSTTGKVTRGCGRKVNSSVTLIPVAVRGITRFLSTSTTITASTMMIKFKQVILTVLTAVDSTVTRATGKLTIAEVAVTGTVKRFISFTIPVMTALYGIISTGGSLYRVTLASMIALTASVTRITGKLTTGTIITTGTTRRALSFRLNTVTAATGVTIRNVSRKITGFSVVTASVVQSKLKLLTLLAVTAITGVLRQTSNRSFLITVNMTVSAAARKLLNLHLNAPITVSSVVYRQLRKTITSTLVIISSSAKGIFRTITLSASVTFTAALSTLKARGVILVSALAVTITVKRGIYRNLNVSATMASGAIRVINRAIQGTFAVAGQTLRGMTRKLTSTVTIRSVLSFSHGYIITVNTLMSVSGSVKRNVRVIEMTVIGVSTDVTRFLRKNIIVPLITFATTIAGRPHVMTLTTGISVTISVTAKFLSTSKVIVIKTGLLATRWITGQIKKNWRT